MSSFYTLTEVHVNGRLRPEREVEANMAPSTLRRAAPYLPPRRPYFVIPIHVSEVYDSRMHRSGR
jgi:hypothetical protein